MRDPQSGWLAHPFRIPRALRPWLTDRGSLTRRLRARCDAFRVVPRRTGLARPLPDESSPRLPRGRLAYVREVELVCDGRSVVYAHTVLPRASLSGVWHGLATLGSRSLGEALFCNPRVRRTTLVWRRLPPGHPLRRTLPGVTPRTAVWARRSCFCLDGAPLWVTEVFLPGLPSS